MGLAILCMGIVKSSDYYMAILFSAGLLSQQSFLYWSFGGLETTLFAFVLFGYCLTLCTAFQTGKLISVTAFGYSVVGLSHYLYRVLLFCGPLGW